MSKIHSIVAGIALVLLHNFSFAQDTTRYKSMLNGAWINLRGPGIDTLLLVRADSQRALDLADPFNHLKITFNENNAYLRIGLKRCIDNLPDYFSCSWNFEKFGHESRLLIRFNNHLKRRYRIKDFNDGQVILISE